MEEQLQWSLHFDQRHGPHLQVEGEHVTGRRDQGRRSRPRWAERLGLLSSSSAHRRAGTSSQPIPSAWPAAYGQGPEHDGHQRFSSPRAVSPHRGARLLVLRAEGGPTRGGSWRRSGGRNHRQGRYFPNLIRLQEGVPVRLIFDPRENSDCSSQVVFPDFGVSSRWPRSAGPSSSSCPRRRESTASPVA